eukprot:365721-Chlamydomonas_euryale.AAC.19
MCNAPSKTDVADRGGHDVLGLFWTEHCREPACSTPHGIWSATTLDPTVQRLQRPTTVNAALEQSLPAAFPHGLRLAVGGWRVVGAWPGCEQMRAVWGTLV